MSLRIVGLFLAAAVLLFVGGFAEVELLTDRQCGATGYLCNPPTADLSAERRYGSSKAFLLGRCGGA
jgi:hypothetical protein